MFKKILLIIFLFVNLINSVDRNRMTIGLSIPTPASSYLEGGPAPTPPMPPWPVMEGMMNEPSPSAPSAGGPAGAAPKPRIIDRWAFQECKKNCLLDDGGDCMSNCLCKSCWEQTVGDQSELIDYCRCRNPRTTNALHF